MTSHDWVLIIGRDTPTMAERSARMAARPGWQQRSFGGSASIFISADCPFLPSPGQVDAAIIGTVFPCLDAGIFSRGIDDATWNTLRHGSIAHFMSRCWGGYVALSSNAERLQIIRDPSAAMPCYYTQTEGLVLVGSNVLAMVEAGLHKPAIDKDRLARSLFRADLPSQETAFLGVDELLPGDCLEIANGRLKIHHVWSPWDYAAIDETVDFADHAERVRDAVETSVTTWGAVSGQTLIGASGGLDSSIIAACLASQARKPICVTVSTDDADGDERLHAHRICDHVGLQLLEAQYELDDIQIDRPARPDLPRPTGRLIAQGYNTAVSRVAKKHGIDAFFTGNGGDNVFAFSQSAGAIADRLLHEGPGSGVWQTAKDICRLTGCSLIQAWRSAIRIASGPRSYRWKPDRQFLSAEILRDFDRKPLAHPWLIAPKSGLPGKAAHIAALLRIQRHLEGTGQLGDVRIINPLMSQPVIETCLAVPSWMWCQGGSNRSVAREAFRAAMPAAITDRISKGGPSGFGTQMISKFHNRIVERLLDGYLATNGIVDRKALELRLRDERPNWAIDQVRVLELLEVEAWIDHWR